MMLGDFDVTVLSDGTFPMKGAELLANVTPKELDADLSRPRARRGCAVVAVRGRSPSASSRPTV
jgi:hypothetical protein